MPNPFIHNTRKNAWNPGATKSKYIYSKRKYGEAEGALFGPETHKMDEVVIKAVALKEGMPPSNMTSWSYHYQEKNFGILVPFDNGVAKPNEGVLPLRPDYSPYPALSGAAARFFLEVRAKKR
jgi:hypothetical protein